MPGDHGVDDAAVLPVERITVALIPQSSAQLKKLRARTGLSKTDLVNRAITVYEFIDTELRAERDLVVVDRKTGEQQRVRLIG